MKINSTRLTVSYINRRDPYRPDEDSSGETEIEKAEAPDLLNSAEHSENTEQDNPDGQPSRADIYTLGTLLDVNV